LNEQQDRERDLVLIADDDDDILRFVEVNLRLEGFDVVTTSDGEGALRHAAESDPDLILLDVMMPGMDGYEVCKRLRDDARTKHMCVIMLTAKSLAADRVVGLTSGADDYIIKPFDPIELVARVKSALRRSREMRHLNPLTGLPGNVQVQDEIALRAEAGEQFAVMYIDIDNFKAFNDHYGFVRGDEAIKLLARGARDSLKASDPKAHFLGHIGGDDFVAIVGADVAEAAAEAVIDSWDREIVALYDPEDVDRGYIEIEDRRKQKRRFPITTVSIGIASGDARTIDNHWVASEIASEMKNFAKRDPMSSYAIDRRQR
jgi:diguanylate cyclase (GGDEF)-like protein